MIGKYEHETQKKEVGEAFKFPDMRWNSSVLLGDDRKTYKLH